jgi:hypothetical protein
MTTERFALISVVALSLSLTLAFAPQERQKPKEAADFPTLLQQAGKAWEGKQYGGCLKNLREAQRMAIRERVKVIRAALPNAPEGFEKVAPEESGEADSAIAAALAVGVGSLIEQSYQAKSGDGSVRVTITADSPYLQAITMWIANPSLLEKGSELVKYGPHNAVLRKQDDRWNLMVVLGQDLCEVTVEGRKDDFLLKMFDQAAIDKLAGALAN